MSKIFTILIPPRTLLERSIVAEREGGVRAITYLGEGLDVSDGYHTMSELYEHRMALFAALCNTLHIDVPEYYDVDFKAWKSMRHSDGKIPFNDSRYFVAGLQTPHGQISYHMKIDPWWYRFNVPELDKAPEYDGHTSQDAIERLLKL